MTQGQLGENLGVSQVTIAHYESGHRFPKGQPLRNLAQILGVSVDTLLGVDIETPRGIGEFSLDDLLRILLEDTVDKGWQYLKQGKIEMGWTAEEVYLNVIIPIMEIVGNRWARKEIIISQEHLVSERVRTMIDLMTDEELERKRITPDPSWRWMGLCAPSEQHDLVLYMSSQIMRLRGWDVRYLGRGVPLKDLREMLDIYKPKILVFSISLPEHRNGLDAYLEDLTERKRMPEIIVGGRGWDNARYSNIQHFSTLQEYIEFIDQGSVVYEN